MTKPSNSDGGDDELVTDDGTTAVAHVEETWVEQRDSGRWMVRYRTEGEPAYSKTGTKSILAEDQARCEAERIAESFERTELDVDFFIP